MLNKDYTTKLLGLQDLIVEKVEENKESLDIFGSLPVSPHACPRCGAAGARVHDYRMQTVLDLDLRGMPTRIHLRKRRYVCPCCGKRFYENNSWLSRYLRRTFRVTVKVIVDLKDSVSYTKAAQNVHLSVNTVLRIFDGISYSGKSLPRVLLIDEFRGNAGKEKFQCILMDGETKQIVDILPNRDSATMAQYFAGKDTANVKYFVSDMWRPYRDLCRKCFPKARMITDKYHVIRQVGWAIDDIRKKEQKKLNKDSRLRYKHMAKLLRTPRYKLSEDEKEALSHIFFASHDIEQAYWLKERFYEIYAGKDRKESAARLVSWCGQAANSGLPRFVKYAKTVAEWGSGILNSIEYGYTNGAIEGMNNKIKVLKRVSYGVRNFKRFRNRILHLA